MWRGGNVQRLAPSNPAPTAGASAEPLHAAGWRERVLRAWPSAKDALLASGSFVARLYAYL